MKTRSVVKFAASVAMISTALLAGGCWEPGSNLPYGQTPRYVEGRAEVYSAPQIFLVGPNAVDLRENTLFEPPMVTRDPGDLLRVTVPVRVTGDKRLHVQYRATFVDRNGQPLPGMTGWARQTLTPGARDLISFNSTSAQANGFHVEIRYAE
ncbi:MAG: DUF1425 domain-containing protein [Phycisphaerae bacterium]|nr:DUF1425 domain-containing protein [Tepidisphaeraceae bacterium]